MKKFQEWVNLREIDEPNEMTPGGNTTLAQAEGPGFPDDSGSEAEELLRTLPINPMLKRRLIQTVEQLHALVEEDRNLSPSILKKIVNVMLDELSGVGLKKTQAMQGVRHAF